MARESMVAGYQTVYLTSDGRMVHGDCATSEDTQHRYPEGATVECDCLDVCGRLIQSDYGDPLIDISTL